MPALPCCIHERSNKDQLWSSLFRQVLDASDDDSDGLGRAPEPLQRSALQLPAAVQKLPDAASNGAVKLPAASSEQAVQPANDDGSAAPAAKGTQALLGFVFVLPLIVLQ